MPVLAGRKARHGGCSQLAAGEDEEIVAVTLDDLAREGARRMIATVLEAEVADYVGRFGDERDDDGKRLVVRNGRARGAQADGRVGDRADPRVEGQRQARRRADRTTPAVQLADLVGVREAVAEGQRRVAVPARPVDRGLPPGA
jgi:hypothetical protein